MTIAYTSNNALVFPRGYAGATEPIVPQSTGPDGTTTETLPVSIDASNLSPEALMAYCQSRLDSIDGQMKTNFAQQEARNAQTAAIQQVLGNFQSNAGGVGKGDSAGPTKCADMEKSLYALVQQLKASGAPSSEVGKLTQMYNDLVYTGTGPTNDTPYVDSDIYPPHKMDPPGDNCVDSQEMDSFISTLQGCVSDLNSGSELQMIQLQSLMSERQTAVSLTTNLVQSLGDQAQKIADNIGH